MLGVLFACVILPLTLFPKHGGSVYSRYLTIDSVVERGTIAIEDSPLLPISGTPDIVKAHGHSYSDKPPVLPVLASAVYGGLYLSGWHFWNPNPKQTAFEFLVVNAVLTWVVAGFTSAMAVVGIRQILQAVPISRWVADVLALAFGFCSQLLTYAVTFNNHSVAAGLIMGAIAATSLEQAGRNPGRRRFLAGLFASLAAVIDLPVGCLILAGMGAIQTVRARSVPWPYLLGAIGPLLLHCWLQSKVTGTPLPAEMYPELFNYPGSYWTTPDGTFKENGPRIWFGLELVFGPQGWLTVTPAILIGLVGLGMVLVRKGDPFRPMAVVVAGSVVVLVVYYTWMVRRTDFAGLSFGTRHLLAITPPCFVFAGVALSRLRGWLAPLVFVVLMAVGGTYAWIGVKNPWSRIEILEKRNATLQTLQWFVPYPWSSMRR